MNNTQNINIWLVRAGKKGEHEEKFLSENRIYLTWENLNENLKNKNIDEIKTIYEKIYPDKKEGKKRNHIGQIISFVSKMNINDIVILPSKKRKNMVYIGKITGDYTYDAKAEDPYYHYRPTFFINNPISRDFLKKSNNNLTYQKTICNITTQLSQHLEFLENILTNKKITKNFNQNNYNNNNKLSPLNLILYGPPGTGKTYKVVEKALEIIFEKETDNSLKERYQKAKKNNNREELKKIFDKYRENGQIEFITFHQNYSYEEFVEGIKPDFDDEENLKYKVEDGIFKKIVKKAQEHIEKKKSFDTVFKELIIIPLKNNEKIKIPMKKTHFFIKEITPSSIKFDKAQGESQHTLSINTLKKMYDAGKNEIIISGLQPYYDALLSYLLKSKTITKPENPKNFVLIIDEINRGNISKIFGELITLIEEDKRLGNEEAITVKLPYSNEPFGVPKNLYIVGTMNTADRSIALMDTALRRRFHFEEIMPEPKLLKDIKIDGTEIDLTKMLETINTRIEYLYDRDHTIGHAYFMPLKEEPTIEKLEEIFRNKIIPLLQEYFYDDWEKIQIVLGDHYKLNDIRFIQTIDKDKDKDLYLPDEYNNGKKIYKINKTFSPDTFIQIYQKPDNQKAIAEPNE